MKILLISIDLILGTRILINVLKNKKFEVKNLQIVDIKYSDTFSQKALDNIYKFSREYDAVGLSFNSFYSLLAAQLGTYLKSKGMKYIIAGGPHVTAKPREVMAYSDIAVIYEAELTLPRILDNLDKNISLGNIKGIVFKDKNKGNISTGCPEIESNLDNLSFQSFSPKDIIYYSFANDKFQEPTIDNLFPHGGKNCFVMTSRGCPFKCSYCCNSLFADLNERFTKIRKRSVQNIITEMDIAKQTGFKGFYIADDNFLAFTLEEIENFSKAYKSRINLPFGLSGLNPNNMRSKDSAGKIERLLNCGLSDVRIGVQSGSNKTLKVFNRRYTSEEVPVLLNIFRNRKTIWDKPNDKLRVAVDFICDAPWESKQDRWETLKLANNLLPTYGIFFYTLVYLPGTDIYKLALKKGWIKDEEKDIYLKGIAGVEDNIYNQLFFLVAALKERGVRMSDKIMTYILKLHKKDSALSKEIIDFFIKVINGIEEHHGFNVEHLILHPYLKGFNKWEKTTGNKGKKVLFRSYHKPYG